MTKFYYVRAGTRMMAVLMEEDVSSIEDLLAFAKKKWANPFPKSTWSKPSKGCDYWVLIDKQLRLPDKIINKKVLEINLLQSTKMT